MSTSHNEPSGTVTAPVFDPARMAVLMEMDPGDSTMIKEIAAQFVTDITGVMARVDTAICTGNFSQIASVAHTIKGSAATFGLYRLETIARELEAAAKDTAKHDAIPGIYQSLRQAFDAGRGAMESYLSER